MAINVLSRYNILVFFTVILLVEIRKTDSQNVTSQAPTFSRTSSKLSLFPTEVPSRTSTVFPSPFNLIEEDATGDNPSSKPTDFPIAFPSSIPSVFHSTLPSVFPSSIPSVFHSTLPSVFPSSIPSVFHSTLPSVFPSASPTAFPTAFPTTNFPTNVPTASPSSSPSASPSATPSKSLSEAPSLFPSSFPSISPRPSLFPSATPSINPTTQPTEAPSNRPSRIPTVAPSSSPTSSSQPSRYPSAPPSLYPTSFPTSIPSVIPSTFPTLIPSTFPSLSPSSRPTLISKQQKIKRFILGFIRVEGSQLGDLQIRNFQDIMVGHTAKFSNYSADVITTCNVVKQEILDTSNNVWLDVTFVLNYTSFYVIVDDYPDLFETYVNENEDQFQEDLVEGGISFDRLVPLRSFAPTTPTIEPTPTSTTPAPTKYETNYPSISSSPTLLSDKAPTNQPFQHPSPSLINKTSSQPFIFIEPTTSETPSIVTNTATPSKEAAFPGQVATIASVAIGTTTVLFVILFYYCTVRNRALQRRKTTSNNNNNNNENKNLHHSQLREKEHNKITINETNNIHGDGGGAIGNLQRYNNVDIDGNSSSIEIHQSYSIDQDDSLEGDFSFANISPGGHITHNKGGEVSNFSLISEEIGSVGSEYLLETDATNQLRDEFDQFKDPGVEKMRADICRILPNSDDMISQSITFAGLKNDEDTYYGLRDWYGIGNEGDNRLEIEVSMLCDANDWKKKNQDATEDEKRSFIQDIMNKSVSTVVCGLVEPDGASRTIHGCAAILSLPLSEDIPKTSLIVTGLRKTTETEFLKESFRVFGEIEGAAVAPKRGFGLVRYKTTKPVQKALDTFRNGEIVVQDVAVTIKLLASEKNSLEDTITTTGGGGVSVQEQTSATSTTSFHKSVSRQRLVGMHASNYAVPSAYGGNSNSTAAKRYLLAAMGPAGNNTSEGGHNSLKSQGSGTSLRSRDQISSDQGR